MGAVWRAEHLGWQAPVAIKIMMLEHAGSSEPLGRFEREVRLAAGLRSPHVVQVLDHGIDERTGAPFIAMELLEGETLAQRLRRVVRLSPLETFQVVSHVVRALTRAHGAGIVHRDLKPENVFLVSNEDESIAKILDFGVAKWTAPSIPEGGLTRPGRVLGTPFYMSPEQIQGLANIDARADLWALAAMTCECLTGRRPFEASDFARLAVLLLSQSSRPVPSQLGPVPVGFDAWFARATAADITKRFQSARELLEALAPICGAPVPSQGPEVLAATEQLPVGGPASVAAVSHTNAPLSVPKRLWRRPLVPLLTSTLLSFLVFGGGITYWYRQRLRDEGTPPAVTTSASPLTPTSTTADGTRSEPGAQPNGAPGSGERARPTVSPIVRPSLDEDAPPRSPDTDAELRDAPSSRYGARGANDLGAERGTAEAPVEEEAAAQRPRSRAKPNATATKPSKPGRKPTDAAARRRSASRAQPLTELVPSHSAPPAPPAAEAPAERANVRGRIIRTELDQQ